MRNGLQIDRQKPILAQDVSVSDDSSIFVDPTVDRRGVLVVAQLGEVPEENSTWAPSMMKRRGRERPEGRGEGSMQSGDKGRDKVDAQWS